MARKYRNFVNDQNQRFIYPTSDWGLSVMLNLNQHFFDPGLIQHLSNGDAGSSPA